MILFTLKQCVFLDFWDARGSGAIFVVCAYAVGLRGNRLTGMRGTWGVVWRSAHVPTIPFTWLRRANALGPTAHASNHYVKIVDLTLVCACLIPHGVTWISMTIYGHCDVNLVTWAKYSILIGRENFCCALIGRDLKEPLLLLRCSLLKLKKKRKFLIFNKYCAISIPHGGSSYNPFLNINPGIYFLTPEPKKSIISESIWQKLSLQKI